MAKAKCFVEIFCKPGKIITFDFGDFALIIEYCNKDNNNYIHGYRKSGYHKLFMRDPASLIDYDQVITEVIDENGFTIIKKLLCGARIINTYDGGPQMHPKDLNKIMRLISHYFCDYIAEYGKLA